MSFRAKGIVLGELGSRSSEYVKSDVRIIDSTNDQCLVRVVVTVMVTALLCCAVLSDLFYFIN